MNKQPARRQGIVKSKKHPSLKFGQVVFIVDETADIYTVKVSPQSKKEIIDKEDLALT